MKRFWQKTAVVAAGLGLLSAGVLLYRNTLLWSPDSYSAATIDKNALVSSSRPPRVLLVGGSNLPFGVDSSLLARMTGRRAINVGLTMGAGVPYLLAEVEGRVGPGDVVVLSPEYEILHISSGDPSALFGLIWSRPQNAKYLSPSDWAALFDEGLLLVGTAYRETAKDLFRSPPQRFEFQRTYRRSALDLHGDIPSRLRRSSIGIHPAEFRRRSWRAVSVNARRILGFSRKCEERGARVVLSWPPCPESRWKEIGPFLERTGREVTAIVGSAVGDRPVDTVYPDELFYDTVYHLTAEGTERRTRHMAGLVSRLDRSSPPGRVEGAASASR